MIVVTHWIGRRNKEQLNRRKITHTILYVITRVRNSFDFLNRPNNIRHGVRCLTLRFYLLFSKETKVPFERKRYIMHSSVCKFFGWLYVFSIWKTFEHSITFNYQRPDIQQSNSVWKHNIIWTDRSYGTESKSTGTGQWRSTTIGACTVASQ